MTRRVLLPLVSSLLLLTLAACGKTEAPTAATPTAQSTSTTRPQIRQIRWW